MNIGTIVQWGSNTIPDGWLLCDGSAVSRTTYADLFSVIGTQFGTGDGSTTFNLPDLRGRVGVGKSSDTDFDTLGETGGSKDLQAHNHKEYFVTNDGNRNPAVTSYSGVEEGTFVKLEDSYESNRTALLTGDAGTGNSGNLQPYLVTNYIIKALNPDSIKISELDSASSIGSNDLIPIVQSGETKKVTVDTLLDDVETEIQSKVPIAMFGGDANDHVETGMGSCTLTSNTPTGNTFYGTMIVIKHYTNYVSQVAIDVNTGVMYTRILMSGTWQSWKAVTTS